MFTEHMHKELLMEYAPYSIASFHRLYMIMKYTANYNKIEERNEAVWNSRMQCQFFITP